MLLVQGNQVCCYPLSLDFIRSLCIWVMLVNSPDEGDILSMTNTLLITFLVNCSDEGISAV